VWLTGEHDIPTDGALSQVLARAIALGPSAVVIDMSELEFIGTSTLGTIVRAKDFLRRRSGTLTVRSAPPFIRRIIDICGLNELLAPEEAGNVAATALGPWVAASGQPAQTSPWGRAPSRLPAPARHTGAPRAPAVGAGLAQSA
jgi:anti-anti-sigma factor